MHRGLWTWLHASAGPLRDVCLPPPLFTALTGGGQDLLCRKALVTNAPPPMPTQPDQTSADLREQQSMLDVAQASPALMRRRSFYDVETTIKLASTVNSPQQKCCWKEMCSRSDLQIISLNCEVLVILPTFTDNTKLYPFHLLPSLGPVFFFFFLTF